MNHWLVFQKERRRERVRKTWYLLEVHLNINWLQYNILIYRAGGIRERSMNILSRSENTFVYWRQVLRAVFNIVDESDKEKVADRAVSSHQAGPGCWNQQKIIPATTAQDWEHCLLCQDLSSRLYYAVSDISTMSTLQTPSSPPSHLLTPVLWGTWVICS